MARPARACLPDDIIDQCATLFRAYRTARGWSMEEACRATGRYRGARGGLSLPVWSQCEWGRASRGMTPDTRPTRSSPGKKASALANSTPETCAVMCLAVGIPADTIRPLRPDVADLMPILAAAASQFEETKRAQMHPFLIPLDEVLRQLEDTTLPQAQMAIGMVQTVLDRLLTEQRTRSRAGGLRPTG